MVVALATARAGCHNPTMRMRHLVVLALLVGLGAVVASLPRGIGADEGQGFDPRFRRGLPTDVLSEHEPPLERATVGHVRMLTETAFGLAFRREDGERLEDRTEVAWPALAASERQAFLRLAVTHPRLEIRALEGDRVAVERGLGTYRRALDQYLSAHPSSPVAAELRRILRSARETAWPGEPAIHAAAADGWLDLVACLVSLGRNEDAAPTAGQRSVVFEELRREFRELDETERRRVLEVHRPWLGLQAAWAEATPVRRLALRYACLRLLATVLPEDKRITVDEEGDLDMVTYARIAGLFRTVQPAYETYANLARRPQAVLDVVQGWIDAGDEARLARPLLAK